MNIRARFRITWTAVYNLVEDSALTLAAAMSFYTVLSIAPLFMILIAFAGLSGPETQERLIQYIQSQVGNEARDAVTVVLQNARERQVTATWSAAVGFAILFFGATGAFVQLQYSLNAIWKVKARPGQGIRTWICRRLVSLVMILGIGVVLFVSMALSAILSVVLAGDYRAWQAAEILVTLAVYLGLFALIFKYLPDVKTRWSDVWLGAGVTAVLFQIGKFAISRYLGYTSTASAYGAAGSLVILLLWIYYSALIVFFGAELMHAYAQATGMKIEPTANAEWKENTKSADGRR